jgi:hypothetical protein
MSISEDSGHVWDDWRWDRSWPMCGGLPEPRSIEDGGSLGAANDPPGDDTPHSQDVDIPGPEGDPRF